MALPALLQPEDRADVGVFGGSGFYSLIEGAVEQVSVQTPYGAPSDSIAIGRIGGVRVAFLPRHGQHHRIPPHAINYRANLWAMAQLGVTRVIAPTAAGQPAAERQARRLRGVRPVRRPHLRPRRRRSTTARGWCTSRRPTRIARSCAQRSIAVGRELGITVHERARSS